MRRARVDISSKWRVLLVIIVPTVMLYALIQMALPRPATVSGGQADLTGVDFGPETLIALNGQWEFYWDRLLTPDDFASGSAPRPDSLMEVPGVWSASADAQYGRQGTATYRLSLAYPPALADPALRVQNVANAYRLYVNGQLTVAVGSGLDNRADFRNDDEVVIIPLPENTRHVDLVFQVANLNCATGGLRVAPVFGSMRVLEQQRTLMLVLQMFFIGGVFIFGLYYLLLFLLQTKNKTALLFSVFCLITALRSLVWGETPLTTLLPQASMDLRMYTNYLTGYNYVAVVILFVHGIYPAEFKKAITGLALLPSLVFDLLLLFAGPERMTFLTNALYLFLLVQMLYLLGMQVKTVLRRRDDAILMYVAVCTLIWAMNADILNFMAVGDIHFTCMSLFGNLAFILAMSYVQARQQATTHRQLIEYNERLLEADRLKDQVMATEMSFLQAQIKPHFLYNALSAIANVCEKDGKQAGRLIVDLAIYLRGSLQFNNLDRMVTIEKELEFVETYFHIEQARFGQRIQLRKEIDIPLDAQIPVLILQPLVENAVRHGISMKPGGGTVTIRMAVIGAHIVIEIEDDGVGIGGDKLASLLSGDNPAQGVGLRNINSRLLRLYGNGLEASSEPGCTRVRMQIPQGA